MAIKLIALDLDGTLITRDLKVSKANREAIRWAAEQNIHVVVATGRSMGIVPPDVFMIPEIRYLITSNGAIISDKQKGVISRTCIDEEVMQQLIKSVDGLDEMVEYFVEGVSHTQTKFWEIVENAHRRGQKSPYYYYHRVPEADLPSFARKNAKHVEMMCVKYGLAADPRVKMALHEKVLAIGGVKATTSLPFDCEVVSGRAGKGMALMKLADILGVEPHEIMAMGDSLNDLEMIQKAGIGVAMGDARMELKPEADFVTKTNQEDGVAHAIYEMVEKHRGV
ncbi:MAG: HAD family phosphatase [Eubacterium sp.]|nr:HAD family phosphatase [Candidatus Colimonas fimequi]